jgi:hypothetical protein
MRIGGTDAQEDRSGGNCRAGEGLEDLNLRRKGVDNEVAVSAPHVPESVISINGQSELAIARDGNRRVTP